MNIAPRRGDHAQRTNVPSPQGQEAGQSITICPVICNAISKAGAGLSPTMDTTSPGSAYHHLPGEQPELLS